MLKLTSKC